MGSSSNRTSQEILNCTWQLTEVGAFIVFFSAAVVATINILTLTQNILPTLSIFQMTVFIVLVAVIFGAMTIRDLMVERHPELDAQ